METEQRRDGEEETNFGTSGGDEIVELLVLVLKREDDRISTFPDDGSVWT